MPFGEINWIVFRYTSSWEELIVLITDGRIIRGGSADGREGGRERGREDFQDCKQRR